jgi:uncharacterized protein YndB with AHSA1/START domain
MKILMRLALASLAAFVVAFAVMYAVGMAQPRDHVVSRYAIYRQPPERVWATISDWAGSAAWRKDVERIERLPDRDGRPVWKETAGGTALTLVITEEIPPMRMIATVADSSQGFAGAWTYSLAPETNGTRLTIVERGSVDHPLFRFLMRHVFGPTSTVDAYLRDLGGHFGETVTPADAGVKE